MLTYDEARPGAVTRARDLRRNATDAERKLWRNMRAAFPAVKWRRQMPVGPYFADLACFAEKLIIEIDGGQHSAERDEHRTAYLESRGYRLIRFWNNDVLANTAGVLDIIAAHLTSPSQAFGLGPSLSQAPTKVLLSWEPRGRGKVMENL